jgi:hypothetical protein
MTQTQTVVFTDDEGFHQVPHSGYFVEVIGNDRARVIHGRKGPTIAVTTIAAANRLADELNAKA